MQQPINRPLYVEGGYTVLKTLEFVIFWGFLFLRDFLFSWRETLLAGTAARYPCTHVLLRILIAEEIDSGTHRLMFVLVLMLTLHTH